jgi:hypothetical protein
MAAFVHYDPRKERSVNDPSTYWLTQTNILLGAVVAVCLIAVFIGVVQELIAIHRRRAAESGLDRELAEMVGLARDGHAFDLPGLGMTLADGGEELPKKEQR